MSELFVNWHGATWRKFPVQIGTLPDTTATGRIECDVRGEIHDRLCAVMTESYQSVSAIQERAGVSEVSTRKFLARMTRRGVLEWTTQPNPRGGIAMKIYRRKRAQSEAA